MRYKDKRKRETAKALDRIERYARRNWFGMQRMFASERRKEECYRLCVLVKHMLVRCCWKIFSIFGFSKKVLYIAGPITGIENFKDVFADREAELKRAGYWVINPAALPHKYPYDWTVCMRKDIAEMMKGADGVALLPGWFDSTGAYIEAQLARAKNTGQDAGHMAGHIAGHSAGYGRVI